MIKIGILSDTHNILRPQVIKLLQDCDAIIHAGDFTNESVLDSLRLLGNVYVVHGNNDFTLMNRLRTVLRFELGGLRFVMAHEKRNLPLSLSDTDVVIFGHTHQYLEEIIDGRLWLNPGGCGRRRFGQALTMALMYVEEGHYRVEKIELNEN